MAKHMGNHAGSDTVSTAPEAVTRPIAQAGITVAVTGIAVIVALIALYAVLLDQGTLLSPVMGKAAVVANYLHELAHDGRHLLGAPCH